MSFSNINEFEVEKNLVQNFSKKTRNKKRKSCDFCFKRHLKCDRTRPVCKVCASRKNFDCLYIGFAETSDGGSFQGIQKLPRERASNSDISLSTLSNSISQSTESRELSVTNNKFSIEFFLKSKETPEKLNEIVKKEFVQNPLIASPISSCKNGNILFFGPTCYKASQFNIQKQDSIFKKIFETWEIVKNVDDTLPSDFFTSAESKLLEFNFQEESLFAAILKVIPKTKSDIKYYVGFYFLSSMIDTARILSEECVLNYIDEIFVTNRQPNSEGKYDDDDEIIVGIKRDENSNNYKMGIVLFILGISFFDTNFPDCILSFFAFLQGQTTAKSMHLEKVQFLVLKCFFSMAKGLTGKGFSDLVNLVGIMCNCVVEFKLNHFDVFSLYQREPLNKHVQIALNGDLKMLSRLFYIALFLDVICSFQNGKKPFISTSLYPVEWLLIKEIPDLQNNQLQCDMINSMKLFVFHSKRLLDELYKPIGIPKINDLLDNIANFIHNDLNLNEQCYGDIISDDKYQLSFCIAKIFVTSFTLESLISVLAIKKNFRFKDSSEELNDEEYYRLIDNQLVYYCLCVYQLASYMVQCVNKRQNIYIEDISKMFLPSKSNLPLPKVDKCLFCLSISPSFFVTFRIFTEFCQVLFYASIVPQNDDSSFLCIEKLLSKDKMDILNNSFDDVSSQFNSIALREFTATTSIRADIETKYSRFSSEEPHYLTKIYPKFHPALFQKGGLSKNLLAIKFTGLQLYCWFTKLYDEQSELEANLKQQLIKSQLNSKLVQTKEKFIRICFVTFLEKLKQQRDQKNESLKDQHFSQKSVSENLDVVSAVAATETPFRASPKDKTVTKTWNSHIINKENNNLSSNLIPFELLQKDNLILESPVSASLINDSSNNNMNVSDLFHWDMNFVDFSSKINWFDDVPMIGSASSITASNLFNYSEQTNENNTVHSGDEKKAGFKNETS